MELAYALVGEQLDAGDDICGAGKSTAYCSAFMLGLANISKAD